MRYMSGLFVKYVFFSKAHWSFYTKKKNLIYLKKKRAWLFTAKGKFLHKIIRSLFTGFRAIKIV